MCQMNDNLFSLKKAVFMMATLNFLQSSENSKKCFSSFMLDYQWRSQNILWGGAFHK